MSCLTLEILDCDAGHALALTFAPVLQGQPGPAGGTTLSRIAGMPISALTVVWENPAGEVRGLDYRDVDHIDLLAGITITAAAAAGAAVQVQLLGVVDISGLGMAPGRVWLGPNGALTQSPPADGFDVLVGRVVSGQRLCLSFTDHINLEH